MFRKLDKKLLYKTKNKAGNVRECWELKIKEYRYKVTLCCVEFKKEKVLFVDFIPMTSGEVYDNKVKYDARSVIAAIVTMITNACIRLHANIVTFNSVATRKALVKIYKRHAHRYGKEVECEEILEFVRKRSPFDDLSQAEIFTFYVR
jgi:hypothetical protein